MGTRSEAGDKIIEWVLKHRTDPELKCPEHFCTIIYLDPAGEWSRRCPGFMQKATDNNIDVRSKPVNVDKRGLGCKQLVVADHRTLRLALLRECLLRAGPYGEAKADAEGRQEA